MSHAVLLNMTVQSMFSLNPEFTVQKETRPIKISESVMEALGPEHSNDAARVEGPCV